jgi:hypothetical protein
MLKRRISLQMSFIAIFVICKLIDENCELRTQIGLIAVARAFEKASAFYL